MDKYVCIMFVFNLLDTERNVDIFLGNYPNKTVALVPKRTHSNCVCVR